MEDLYEIKHRSRSIREIRHITRAMKMMAAVRLRKAQERVEHARPFARKISEVLVDIAKLAPYDIHPLMSVRGDEHPGLVVITSDRGLCGGYNQHIIDTTVSFLRGRSGKLIAVGKKGSEYFKRNGYDVVKEYVNLTHRPTFSLAQRIAKDVVDLFMSEAVDQTYIVYTRFYSPVEQRPRIFRLLPISPMEPEARDGEEKIVRGDWIFEPDPRSVLNHLLPRYVETEIYRALLESDASENGARMTAMGAATDNADELIEELTVLFNRSRQSEITEEIAEIVGGAEAFNKAED